MFICKNCQEKYYKNRWIGGVISYGRYEECGEIKKCDDTPHNWLEQKKTFKK